MALTADYVTNVPLSFQRMRALLAEAGLQEGVLEAGDLKVTQRAAGGAGPSVDVAIGTAWVRIDTGTRNGMAHVFSDAIGSAAVGAGHATLPRIDQVVLQYNDSSIPAGVGGNVPTLRVIPGTPTSGATLDNRTGAAALPNDCVRLADVLQPAAGVNVTTANIRDRRPRSRGAYKRVLRTAGDHSLNNTSITAIDAVNLASRIECTGAPVRCKLRGRMALSTSNSIIMAFRVDGAVQDGGEQLGITPVAGSLVLVNLSWDLLPTAGSHLIAPYYLVTGGVLTLSANATQPLLFTVEEIIRDNSDNT